MVRKSSGRQGLLALIWAFAGFLLLQGLLGLAIEREPALRDPEFAEKLSRLRKQLAAEPERPLMLILGSSRSSCGLHPADMVLPPGAHSPPPLVFNFALTACGPIQQVELIERLRRFDIHPRWILAEVHPLLLHRRPGVWGEESWMRPEKLNWQDLAVIGPYLQRPGQWRWQWAMLRSPPAWWFRFQLLNCLSPGWLDTRQRQDGFWFDLDDCGWLPLMALDDRQSAERRRLAYRQYSPAFADFEIAASADLALRRLIALSRQDGASLGLFLMPEGDAFRSWYPPDVRTKLHSYLSALATDEQVTLFDATTWCAESDFADSHHLRALAAQRFSRRFGREVAATFISR